MNQHPNGNDVNVPPDTDGLDDPEVTYWWEERLYCDPAGRRVISRFPLGSGIPKSFERFLGESPLQVILPNGKPYTKQFRFPIEVTSLKAAFESWAPSLQQYAPMRVNQIHETYQAAVEADKQKKMADQTALVDINGHKLEGG